MTETNLTAAAKAALEQLKAQPGQPVVLPVSTGSRLVSVGLAVKDDSTGHGKARAAYKAA